jgi:hypothetical protein
MSNKPDVRFVDAHAEGVCGNHDLDPTFQEIGQEILSR